MKVYLNDYTGKKLEILILLIILFIYTIIVHHVSIFNIFAVLFILGISVYIVTGIFPKNYMKIFFMFIVIATSYWIFTSQDLLSFLKLVFSSATSAEGFSIIINTGTIFGNPILDFLSIHLDWPLYALFIFIGIGVVYYRENADKLTIIFALMAMILFIFFVPSPLQTLYGIVSLFRLDRFIYFSMPFIVIILTFGVFFYLLNVSQQQKIYTKIFIVSLIFTMSLFAQITTTGADLYRIQSGTITSGF